MNMPIKKSIISPFVALAMVMAQVVLVPAAQAAMISTQGLVSQQQRTELEQRIMRLLDQQAAREVLADNGVSRENVQQRLNRLSNAELQQLASKTDTLPAGQGVLGVVLAVILILVLLDLLGATDVFPAVDSL